MRWTHDALQEIATMHHNHSSLVRHCLRRSRPADVLAFATAHHIAGTIFMHHRAVWRQSSTPLSPTITSSPWNKTTMTLWQRTHPCLTLILSFSKKEPLDEPEMPAHEAPEPEDEHEEAPIPVLNCFSARRSVYGDGLRRMPSTSAKLKESANARHDIDQGEDSCWFQRAWTAREPRSHRGEPPTHHRNTTAHTVHPL